MTAQGHDEMAVRECLNRALAVAQGQSALALVRRCERSAQRG
jgi:hypothetical protein